MITLASFSWGSGPKIPITLGYEHQRSGADMQYRVQVTIGTLSSSTSYFGYPIYLKLTMDGTLFETTTLKAASPNQWSSAITYTSPWYTVSNKTSGTTVVSFNLYSGSGSTRNDTFSYSMIVDPAASILTAPNGTLGSPLTLSVNKYNTAFTHTINYVCGSASGTVCTQSSATSVAWNTTNGNTVALASQNTIGQSVTVVFTIITYSGSTEVGRNTAVSVCTIPNTVKPTVALAVSDAAGYMSTYGAYVQGWSKLLITATPTLAYGSPIKTYEITADGKTYSTSPVTTDVLQNKGTLSVTAKVTDSRTYPSDPVSTNITVIEYAKPSVTVTAYRCNSGGTADPEGAYMKFGFTATISSLNGKNSATYSIVYKAGNGSATTITGSGLSYTSNILDCDVSQVWSIEVTVTDKLDSTTKAATIPISFTLLDFYSTGKGLSLGKVATRDGFDCAMDSYFGNKRVQEVGTPTATTDAVNLAYVNANFQPAKADAAYPSCYYRTVDGVKEWINPPMVSGVEYRTAERWMGKPVYTKIVSFGKLPNSTSAYIQWYPDSGSVAYVISAFAVTSGGSVLNVVDSANTGSIWIVTSGDYSSQTANVVLKYTKV